MSVSNEKLISSHTFIDGINTTIADESIPPTAARYILNCNILSQGEGSVGVITNVKGNKLISTPLPAGLNKCIGTASDEESNKFYFFVWNENRSHTIQQFDALSRTITQVMENLIDTDNVDILGFDKDHLILHADVIRNSLLYWVDGLNPARKTNLNKIFDKSATGYGEVIKQSFVDAYKKTTPLAPTAIYFSDQSKPFNRLYGAIRKFAVRLLYDDGEKSNVSDFSAVIIPDKEPFTGINTIPVENNGIKISFDTGDRTVKLIEIIMQSTSGEVNDEGLLNWVSLVTLDKKELNISSDSQYAYNYYNDVAPTSIDQAKVIRPYSFLPKRPLCQSFVKNSLVYSNAYEGFPKVDVDATATVRYEDLFLEPGVSEGFNSPFISAVNNDGTYLTDRGTDVTYYNGNIYGIYANYRFARITVTIGADVKKGNTFGIYLTNGVPEDTFNYYVTASNTDSALTIANNLKEQLITSGRIHRSTPNMADANIYDNTIVSGSVSFSFIIKSSERKLYIIASASVNPVKFETLKDTGQSLKNEKLGSSRKYGFIYEDADGRKSLTYTSEVLVLGIKTINDLILNDGKTKYQNPIITIQINHKPPVWAKYYQIVRSNDLVYGDFIQILIQKVIPFNNDDAQDYLDLAVGSLFTYQKIHPNTSLDYEFAKGDRLRLLKNVDTDTYYPFFETEVIAYNATVIDTVKSNLKTDGTATVVVAETKPSDVGKFIVTNDFEREIVSVPSGTTYLLNNVIGDSAAAKTYLTYDLVDRRGSIRIRKPNNITIEDNSMVEVYKPSNLSNPLGSAQFFEFQKKYPVIGYGTENVFHTGNIQNQTDMLSGIVEFSGGTTYVRNREMPVNNAFPGTQLVIDVVEDPSYSDFYRSLMNDNGRINVKDNGDGEVHFGSRMRFSNNFIEDTRINGLNDFDNTDREDYYDQYGDFKRTVFDTNRIFGFKHLKTTIVPVDSIITQDNNGLAINVNSAKLLNPIQYLAWEGGIGNNPESYASNGTHKYFVSANSGVIIRLGGNGEEPISKTYALDNEVKTLLNDAINNKAKIFGGFDRKNGVYVVTIEGYRKYIYFDGFNGWIINADQLPNDTLFEIVTGPTHGTATLTSGFEITYQPDLDYIGHDEFTYRAFINGVWSQPKKACIEIIDIPVQAAWRQKESSYFCVLDEYGLRTGVKGWTTLEEYNVLNGELTGNEKPNDPSDVDYVSPIVDETTCVPQPPNPNPDPFDFIPVIDAELNTVYESNVITPTGFNIPTTVGVDVGEYRLNGGSWTSIDGPMVPGDTLQVRRTSSNLYVTPVTVNATIGTTTGQYRITTRDLVTRYIWGRIFAENVTEVASGIFAADIFLRSYISDSNTVPPAAISANLYNCTNGAIPVSYHQTSSPSNDFNASMSNQNQVRLTAPGTEFQTGYPKQYVATPGFVYYYSFNGLAENEMRVLQTIMI